jgi:hypothetical protein
VKNNKLSHFSGSFYIYCSFFPTTIKTKVIKRKKFELQVAFNKKPIEYNNNIDYFWIHLLEKQ